MIFTRNSKIKEAWKHPVGHDMLQQLSVQLGRSERWAENPLVANLPLKTLDRLNGGPAFVDALLELTAQPAAPAHAGEAPPQSWWREAVFYRIYLPSFMDSDHDGVGDLGGVLQRLPYLERLGVDALWLQLPGGVPAPGGSHAGFCQLDEDSGTLQDFGALASAAHNRNIKLVVGLDVAATGENHPWFRRLTEGEAEPNYYLLQKGSPEAPPNNWCRAAAPAWRWLPQLEAWALCLHGRDEIDLNWDDAELRGQMAKVLKFWLGQGADGFYLGPVNWISKSSLEDGRPALPRATQPCGYEKYGHGPQVHRYLHQLRADAFAQTPAPENQQAAAPAPAQNGPLLAGEIRGVGTEVAKLFTSPRQQELDFVLDMGHLALHPAKARKGKPAREEGHIALSELKQYYLRWMGQYGQHRLMALFLETPDTPRMLSRLGASPVYRAILAKLLGTLMLTLHGAPILYQGQELGLGNTRFSSVAELRDAAAIGLYHEAVERQGEAAALQQALAVTADHARTPMPWSAGPNGGFTGAQPWLRMPDGIEYLNAAAQLEDANSVLNHYQRLIALRKQNGALLYGSFNPVFVKNKKVFCYFRIHENEKWYVEMNLTEKEAPRPGRLLRTMRLTLSNYDAPARALRPYEANVYRCD